MWTAEAFMSATIPVLLGVPGAALLASFFKEGRTLEDRRELLPAGKGTEDLAARTLVKGLQFSIPQQLNLEDCSGARHKC